MGKDLHNDDFEDFFKKHLENFDDDPADYMWEHIEAAIPPKPGFAWSAYALPAALILSLTLLIFVGFKMFEYKKTSEDLTEKLEQSNRDVSFFSDTSTENNNVLISKDAEIDKVVKEKAINEAIIMKSETETDDKLLKKNTNRSASEINKITKNKTFSNSLLETAKRAKVTTKTNDNNSNNAIDTNPLLIPISPNIGKEQTKSNIEVLQNSNKPIAAIEDKVEWNLLAMKSSSVLSTDNWQLNNGLQLNNSLKAEKKEDRNSITLFVTPTILKNNIRPPKPSSGNNPLPPPSHPRPVPTENIKLGQAIGVKYGYDLTDKLSLNIGGMYANTSYNFSTRHFLPYNKNTEQDISTDKAGNTIDYSGSSTYGEYSVDADITRLRDNGVVQNEEININIDATAQIHSVIVPIYMTYKILERNDFSIGIKGGLSYNNVIQNSLEINDFNIEKPGFEVEEVRLNRRPEPSKNGTINTLSGVVLAYDFQDNWSFMVEPTWISALSDNHKADFGRTKSNMLNVDIGLKYSF